MFASVHRSRILLNQVSYSAILNHPDLFAAITDPGGCPSAQVSKQLPDGDLYTVMGGSILPSPVQQNMTLNAVLLLSLT